LEPWVPLDDARAKRVCTVIHDDLGQPKAHLLEGHLGKAGIYFHPSRVAGDGYRVWAQLSFEPVPGEARELPNRAVLQARHGGFPRAQTARLRNWKKASIRGVVNWFDPANPPRLDVAAYLREMLAYFRPAFLHFVAEEGGGDLAQLPVYAPVDGEG